MKKRIYSLLFIWLIIYTCLHAQQDLISFSPGAKSIGLGRTGVIDVYDPSALYWNPASLGFINKYQTLFSIHQPFHLNYSAYSHFIPRVGSLAMSMAQTDMGETGIEIYSAGWGKKINDYFYAGFAINDVILDSENWVTGGVGFLVKPETSAYYQNNHSSLPGFLGSPLILDRLTMGVSIQNIPLTDTYYDHVTRIGASYTFTRDGFKLMFAQHIKRGNDSSHLGLIIPLQQNLQFFAGIRDYLFNKTALGAEISLNNIDLHFVYDYDVKRILFSTAIRLGSSGSTLAEQEYSQAQKKYTEGDQLKALYYSKRALEYDTGHKKAAEMVTNLEPVIKQNKKKIKLLLQAGRILESREYYISAATQYMQVLKLDPDNKTAQIALNRISPRVNIHTENRYNLGVTSFENNDLVGAKNIFESILLVRPDHTASKQYLAKINDLLFTQAENHFFTGLGYYSQRKLADAEKEFQNALEIVPAYTEAKEYLDRIAEDKINNLKLVIKLLEEGQDFEAKKSWFQAREKYRQVLEIDPVHSEAQNKLAEMDVLLADYVNEQVSKGESLYNSGQENAAQNIFTNVLRIQPGNAKAARYMSLIAEKSSGKSTRYFENAQNLYNQGNWKASLAAVDSSLKINPRFNDAVQLKNKLLKTLNVEEMLENAKNEYAKENYTEAMERFNQILEKDQQNTQALNYLEQCQKKLAEKVDEYFNKGLELYSRENYRLAIQYWQKALEINPSHKGSIEYSKRATERIKALERLQ